MTAPRPFSTRQLADRWGCSQRHVQKLIEDGKLRAFDLGDRMKRVSAAEVARFEGDGWQGPTLVTDSSATGDATPSPGRKAAAPGGDPYLPKIPRKPGAGSRTG